MNSTSNSAIYSSLNFMNYLYEFYGDGGIYDLGATRNMIKSACLIYLISIAQDKEKNTTWGDGDSLDRERVRSILEDVFNLKEKEN